MPQKPLLQAQKATASQLFFTGQALQPPEHLSELTPVYQFVLYWGTQNPKLGDPATEFRYHQGATVGDNSFPWSTGYSPTQTQMLLVCFPARSHRWLMFSLLSAKIQVLFGRAVPQPASPQHFVYLFPREKKKRFTKIPLTKKHFTHYRQKSLKTFQVGEMTVSSHRKFGFSDT